MAWHRDGARDQRISKDQIPIQQAVTRPILHIPMARTLNSSSLSCGDWSSLMAEFCSFPSLRWSVFGGIGFLAVSLTCFIQWTYLRWSWKVIWNRRLFQRFFNVISCCPKVHGDVEAVQLLLNSAADAAACDSAGEPLLCHALRNVWPGERGSSKSAVVRIHNWLEVAIIHEKFMPIGPL